MRKLLSIILYQKDNESQPEWVSDKISQTDEIIDLFIVSGDNKFSAYNKIISSLHSIYVVFLEHNDELTTEFIDYIKDMNYNDDIYFFDLYKRYSDKSLEYNKTNVYHAHADIISRAIINYSYNEIGLNNKLVKVDLIKRLSLFFNENLGKYVERYFLLTLLHSNPKIRYVNRPLIIRQMNNNRVVGYVSNLPLLSINDIPEFNNYLDAISNLFGKDYSDDISNLKIRLKENCIQNGIFNITDYNYFISPNSIVSIWHQDWGVKRRVAIIVFCILNSIGFHTS